MAWAWVASQASGPVLFALSRQKVATFKREASFDPRSVWRGAYAVREPESPPDVVLVATGSEVPLACETDDRLREEGTTARVVSCPSLELFLTQPDDYQRALIPEDGPPVVIIEALRAESFRRLVGRRGFIHGVDRFGASAPSEVLAEAYGFTSDRLAARVLAQLGR
jgi:transketolase